MPSNDVDLNISATEKNETGWERVVASDGTPYWYMFTGGNNGNNGNQNFVANNQDETFSVDFKVPDRPLYDFVTFYRRDTSDPDEQLSGKVSADKKSITVKDVCTAETADMVYGVIVSPVGSDAEFTCHPVITNRQQVK